MELINKITVTLPVLLNKSFFANDYRETLSNGDEDMAYQSEAELEQQFIDQLNKQGYSTVSVPDYNALVENFKVQFEYQ